jgi:intracellular multiplication protein IcmQ
MNNLNVEFIEFQNRKRLLDCLTSEKQHIMAAIEKFYSQKVRQEESALQALEEMISAFDRVITAGDWEDSLFLRNIVKPLKNMRAEAERMREQLLGTVKPQTMSAPVLEPGMVKVYIGIFQNKAHSAQDWGSQLRALPQYILGRPVYREESAVQQAIRNKLVQTSDAYVCVAIPETAIQSNEWTPSQLDKQGNALLQLLPGSVRSENILEFVYQDKHYYYKNNQLIEIIGNSV